MQILTGYSAISVGVRNVHNRKISNAIITVVKVFPEGTEVTDTHTLSSRALRYVITRISDDSSLFPSLSLYTVTIAPISRIRDNPLDSYNCGESCLMNGTIGCCRNRHENWKELQLHYYREYIRRMSVINIENAFLEIHFSGHRIHWERYTPHIKKYRFKSFRSVFIKVSFLEICSRQSPT